MEDLDKKIIELMDLFDDERIPFDNGGSALKQKYLKEDYAKYGKDKLEEATKILLSDDFGRASSSVTNFAIQDAKRLGLNTYEKLPRNLKSKIRNQINKYGRVIPESEARLLGREEKTATDKATIPTKGARIVKGNYTRDYTTLELKNLAEDGLYDPYKNKFAEGVPEKKLVKDRIVDIEFSDPETKKKFFEDFEKRFKYLRGSKQLKKLEIDNAGLYKKYLSNLEPKTAELALAGLRNSLIEKTRASGGDESKYFYRAGNHIENRGSMVNFSVIGRNCTQEQREEYYEWDKEKGERKKISTFLKHKFKELDAVIGGQISIDIYPKGMDKSQVLNVIEQERLVKPDEYIFIGDGIENKVMIIH